MRRIKGLVIYLIFIQIVILPLNLSLMEDGNLQASGTTDTITEISQFDDNYREMRGLNIGEEIIAIPTIDSILFLNKTHRTLVLEYQQFPDYNFNRDIIVVGEIAYMTDNQQLTLLNITDFENVTILSTYQQYGWKRNLVVKEGYAVYTNDGEYIEILNVSNPKNIQYLGNFQHSESVNSFAVNQNCIYGISSSEFFTINTTEKNAPEKMDMYEPNPEEQFYSFVLRSDLVYINSAEIIILNCSHPEDILYYKTIILSRDTQRYLLGEDIAFSLEVNHTIPFQTEYFIQVYNLTDLDAISSITNFTSEIINWSEMERWTLFGLEILWHSYYDLISFDIGDLVNIKVTKEFSCGHYSSDVLIEGSRAFVADYRGGIEIFDIENITKPTKIYQSNHSYCSKLIRYQNFLFILSE